MKTASIAAMALALVTALATFDADARRLGGGRSFGMQRQMPAKTAPDATPAKPAAPAQQAAPTTAPNAAAAPGAAAKPGFLGRFGAPLAGLAAGLGLAALMSHLGLSEAFGSVLLIVLLAIAAIVVVRLLMRRRQPQPQSAGMAYSGTSAGGAQVAWPAASAPAPGVDAAADPAAGAAAAPAEAPPARAFVPAAFDAEGFARTAKMIFIRLQAANDAGDLDDLRSFTTPEVYAELSADLLERGAGSAQTTEVQHIESEVLDVTDEPTHQIVSVRFRGQVREAAGAAPVAVDEVWHLTKPHDGSRNWAIAGIEQWQ